MGLRLRCRECGFRLLTDGWLTDCVFPATIRGGMIAPMVGGQLLMIDVSFPVYASAVTFVIAGVCVLFLKEAEKQEGDERVVLH